MQNNIRGLKCSLDCCGLVQFLKCLPQKEWFFFAPWCLLNDHCTITDTMDFLKDFSLFEDHNIWELELQCTQHYTGSLAIQTYEDFCEMPCICYILYYDCGNLELYIKDSNDLLQFQEYLEDIGVQDLTLITDSTDTRTGFTV